MIRKFGSRFRDAPLACRCAFDITLKDGSGAQCGRRATHSDLCTQHWRLIDDQARAFMLSGASYEGVRYSRKGEKV